MTRLLWKIHTLYSGIVKGRNEFPVKMLRATVWLLSARLLITMWAFVSISSCCPYSICCPLMLSQPKVCELWNRAVPLSSAHNMWLLSNTGYYPGHLPSRNLCLGHVSCVCVMRVRKLHSNISQSDYLISNWHRWQPHRFKTPKNGDCKIVLNLCYRLLLGCCLIPFFVNHFKDAYHTCPRCRRVLHVQRKACRKWTCSVVVKYTSVFKSIRFCSCRTVLFNQLLIVFWNRLSNKCFLTTFFTSIQMDTKHNTFVILEKQLHTFTSKSFPLRKIKCTLASWKNLF